MMAKTWIAAGLALAAFVVAPTATAGAGGPRGYVNSDCLGAEYEAVGIGGTATHWELLVGDHIVKSGDGSAFAWAGTGNYFKATVLKANGAVVAEYDGVWCV